MASGMASLRPDLKREYKRVEFAEVKALMREVQPEKGPGGMPLKKPSKVPAFSQPTYLFVGRDLSNALPVNRYDEVFPGIVLGDCYLARQKEELRLAGITHVLNAAQGERFNQIDTNAEYYSDIGVQFLGIPAQDVAKFQLTQFFTIAADFIYSALKSNGRVFVHCHQGISRSATLVLCYLMVYHNMSLPAAVMALRKRRPIFPNDGFLKQLCHLHNERFVQNEDQLQSSGCDNHVEEHI